MAFGMISWEMSQQGYECTVRRPFYTTIEGLDLLDEPLPEDMDTSEEEIDVETDTDTSDE